LCWASRAGRRERPPLVVSPLMLALTMRGVQLFGLQLLFEQRDPAAAARQPVFGGQAVAHHQHGFWCRIGAPRRRQREGREGSDSPLS
jgi:hypothetical protein